MPDSTALPTTIPVCPVRGSVIYPTMVQHIDASRAISINAIEAAMSGEKVILIVSQKDKDVDDPKGEDLYDVGTACNVLRVRKNPDGTLQMLVSAVARVQVSAYALGDYLTADIEPLDAGKSGGVELQALSRELKDKFETVASGGRVSAELGVLMTALALFSGSLWAKPTWGTYWTWDPRLTTTAVGLLIYLGYFIIRGLIDDPHRRARVAAVLGIVGTLYIPVNYMSVYWWRSIHQTATVKILGKLELAADPRMLQAFFTMLAAFTVLYFFLVRLRGILAKREEARELARDEAELRGLSRQGGV